MFDREMSGELRECPLCLEELEVDDLSFYPCPCGYQVPQSPMSKIFIWKIFSYLPQICRFCWNRILTVGNGLCPACRREFSDTPEFQPVSTEELWSLKVRFPPSLPPVPPCLLYF